jgi:hypothetical protein
LETGRLEDDDEEVKYEVVVIEVRSSVTFFNPLISEGTDKNEKEEEFESGKGKREIFDVLIVDGGISKIQGNET